MEHNRNLKYRFYHPPEAPPPPDRPPPPLNPPPEERLLPELHDPPEPPDEKVKPPIEALPFVAISFRAFLYDGVFLKISFTRGNNIR